MNTTKYFQQPSKFLLNIVQEGEGLELLRDLKEEVAQLVIFDPQYENKNSQRINWNNLNYYSYPNLEQKQTVITTFFQQIERILKPNGFVLLWINQRLLLENGYKNWLTSNLKVIEILIWLKGNFFDLGFHKHFRPQTEYSLLIQKEPYQKKVKDRGIGQVFSEIVNFTNRHNTHTKPYQMTRTIIKQLTQEGDLVIDPCAGSFVSLRACQSLKRDFLGTDLTLRELMKFNINKERSRELLKLEKHF